ncbi:PPC domain-containing protein [Luteolibacter sp. LG18]|uniref:PPC domain-containing protein n=1 Tax=Luteolibacter sp. LG18 TaxID=2819286 RepID=UPI002B3246DD|nr:serine protease [Luteolibacter sp. LG18]
MTRAVSMALALLPAALHAFSPELSLIVPRGGQQGTEVAVEFRGDRLEEVQEALFYDSGIALKDLEVKDGKKAVAKLVIAADAHLGQHVLRLRSPGGLTELRTFWVGQFPTVAEVEPNNSFDQPQKVDLNVTVAGVAGNEDEDYYVCSLKKGQRLSVEVEGMRLGRTMFDPYVAILDPRKFEVASCDDAPLLKNDAFATIIAPEDGDYRVVVREAAYEGTDQCDYRLHIGSFPRPSAVFPPGGKPGETLEFRLIGDPAGPIVKKETLPQNTERFPLFASVDGLLAPSANQVVVSPLEHAEETEPNNSREQATQLPAIPCAGQGILEQKDDVDCYKFHAAKGDNLVLKVMGRALRSPIDAVLRLRAAKDGKQLGENDDQGGPDPLLAWTCPEDGDYVFEVRDKLGRGGPDYTYRLEILRKEPAIAAAMPVVERNNSQKWKTFVVPRGNRYAALINVTRENVACDMVLEAASLPAGVTMNAPGVPKSTSSFPVVFEAKADAPVAGALYHLGVRSTGDGPALKGELGDAIHLVDVNNQGSYHSVPLDRIAMAVINEAPVKIELDPPAVPIVRNGILQLKVRAIRSEGYNDAITVRFLWSPPGIGAPTTIQIPAGQSEAMYEINANGDAPVAEWKVCVLAEAPTPKGTVLVSSALVPLKVVEPYLTMTMDMAATEQGKAAPMTCKLEVQHPFNGDATAELLGLPGGVTTTPVTFNKDKTEIVFPLTVAGDAPVNKHGNLFCRVTVPENGTTILHQVGQGGTLRIDKPSQPVAKATQPEKPPEPGAPAAPAAPAAKPLSRLEQLRQRTP